MAEAEIKKKPSKAPTGVTVTFDGDKWTANWKVHGNMTNTNRNDRYTSQNVTWTLDITEPGTKKKPINDPPSTDVEIGSGTSSETKVLSEFYAALPGIKKGKKSQLSRKSFFPYTNYHVTKVSVSIKGVNKKGKSKPGKASCVIELPTAPKCEWTYDHKTGKATLKVKTTDDSSKNKDWHRTAVTVTLQKKGGNSTLKNTTTQNTEEEYEFDVSGYLVNLQAGDKITLSAEAKAQGLRGESVTKKNQVIAMPSPGSIGNITVSGERVSVQVKSVGPNTETIQLQRRSGDTGNFTDVPGGVGGQYTKYLYDSLTAAQPNPGDYAWYRLKSMRHEYEVYGAPVKAWKIYTPKPKPTCSATVAILQSTLSKDGEQATVVVGYSDTTNNEGTEISWSNRPNAWSSTDGPETATFEAADSPKHSKAARYKNSMTITINGLEQAETYYIRARRYRKVDGETVYSGYCTTYAQMTNSAADDSCGIVESSKEVDGHHATIVVGIQEDNENTGTELSWSSYQNAWNSNQQPETFNAEWPVDDPRKSTAWGKTHTIYLAGLDQGTTYFVKARRYLTSSSGKQTFSPYSQVSSFTTLNQSTSMDVRCALLEVEPGADGTSASCVIGWDGDHSGCEVTWSENEDAWDSTEQPSSYEFATYDAESRSDAWSHTSTVVVRGLDEGVMYFFRARCYYDGGDERSWSDYSETMSATSYAAPEEVVLTAPATVPRGEAIECYWTISGELEQKEWHIHPVGFPNTDLASGEGSLLFGTIPADNIMVPSYSPTEDEQVDPAKTYYVSTGDGFEPVAEPVEEDLATYYELNSFDDSPSSIEFYVEAGVGGGLTASEPVTVEIADVPSCEIAATETLVEQPLTFSAFTDNPSSDLLVTLASNGVSYEAPDGSRDQVAGDVIWTGRVSPTWAASTWEGSEMQQALQRAVADAQAAISAAQAAKQAADDALAGMTEGDEGYEDAVLAAETAEAAVANAQTALADAQAELAAHASDGDTNAATVALPASLPLVDGASYTLSVRAVEEVAGLTSEPATATVGIAWSHQAPVPSDGITVTPNQGDRTVTINLVPPDGAAEGDAYDVYRKTQTGYERIASDVALTAAVTDRYAPFGKNVELSYRVCCRTADGDEVFEDYEYSLPATTLRFDWGNSFVELPWNLEMSDSYEKPFERRMHMDGSVNGYFDVGFTRDGSFTTDVNRAESLEQANLVHELGEYSGPVFCRTHLGAAFQCNVDVRDITMKHGQASMPVSLSVQAYGLTDDFRCSDSDIEEG